MVQLRNLEKRYRTRARSCYARRQVNRIVWTSRHPKRTERESRVAVALGRLGSDADVLGRTITLNEESYTVVGVLPARFQHPETFQLWTPMVAVRGE